MIDKDSGFIGYITLETIQDTEISQIKKSFMNAKGVIIDIRNYPATFVPFALGEFFTSTRKPFAKFTTGNLNNPGEFNFSRNMSFLNNNTANRNSLYDFKTSKSENYFQGKLVVIVNEATISQAEYTAMAFRAGDNTTIIGSQTQGADGNVSLIPLPGGIKAGISGLGVYYPDGRGTQRIGIVPDIEVKPTIQGIREGRDELLERAIELIQNDKNQQLINRNMSGVQRPAIIPG
jgi:C-terminal processing protease CtpA/Prc